MIHFFSLKGATLGPDIYDNSPLLEKPSLSGAPTGVTLLPIAFVAAEGQNGSWQYTAAESNLEVSVGTGNEKETVSLKSLPAPLMPVVASATSSYAGPFGSPTLFSRIIRNTLKSRFNLTIVERKLVETVINKCLPVVRNTKS